MSEAAITLCVLAAVVVLFVWNRLPVELVAVGASMALAATGVLDLGQAVAGFGDPTVLFIASLFVVSGALDATGVTAWAGERLTAVAGGDRRRLLVATMLLAALLTAIISVNGAVAALLPMVVVLALRQRLPTSQLLMPLAFAAHAGSMLALTGTPVNVLVSDAADEAGVGRFGFFEFALVGLPPLAARWSSRWRSDRGCCRHGRPGRCRPTSAPTPGRCATSTCRVAPSRDCGWPPARPSMATRRPPSTPCSRRPSSSSACRWPGRTDLAVPVTLRADDVVIVRGDPAQVRSFAATTGLVPNGRPVAGPDLLGRRLGVAEVVVPPRSGLIGEVVFPGMVTDSGDLIVLAVQRRGEDLGPAASRISVGDTLLLQGEWSALDREIDTDRDVLAIDDPALVRRQAVPLGPKSTETVVITVAMVVLLATGVVAPAAAGLLAAGALVLTGVMSMPRVYQSISWTTVVLVAGMIPVSTAMQVSGAADDIAELLVDLVGDAGPRVLLLALFVLAAAVGAVISNTATALVLLPIAASVSVDLGVSPKPVLLGVGVSRAAAFLTPITTPANLMVMGPGGYRFGDYWKYGLPLLVLYGVVVVFYIPLIWRF